MNVIAPQELLAESAHRNAPRWYVAQTEPNCERRAVLHSARYGVIAFLPYVMQQVRVQGQLIARRALMFPNYIFLQLEQLNEWHALRRDGFVFTRLLGTRDSGAAVPVATSMVTALKARMVDGAIPMPLPAQKFQPGQKVRVPHFASATDLFGVVQNCAGGRVAVLLSLFNRTITVRLDEDAVIAA